jgi:hypothetical protein
LQALHINSGSVRGEAQLRRMRMANKRIASAANSRIFLNLKISYLIIMFNNKIIKYKDKQINLHKHVLGGYILPVPIVELTRTLYDNDIINITDIFGMLSPNYNQNDINKNILTYLITIYNKLGRLLYLDNDTYKLFNAEIINKILLNSINQKQINTYLLELIIHIYIKVASISKLLLVKDDTIINFNDIINSNAKTAILSDTMFQSDINRHFLTAILFICSQLETCYKAPIT